MATNTKYNDETWEIFKYSLISGCTFTYKIMDPKLRFIPARITPELKAAFSALSWNQAWDILHVIPGNIHCLYNFCWPDGTPMEGWQTYEKPRELTKEERVIKKCQSLDAKFKAKSLPRCTIKPLSFPDKKVPLPNKKETSSINDDFLHFHSTNTYRPRTAITESRAGITSRTTSWVDI